MHWTRLAAAPNTVQVADHLMRLVGFSVRLLGSMAPHRAVRVFSCTTQQSSLLPSECGLALHRNLRKAPPRAISSSCALSNPLTHCSALYCSPAPPAPAPGYPRQRERTQRATWPVAPIVLVRCGSGLVYLGCRDISAGGISLCCAIIAGAPRGLSQHRVSGAQTAGRQKGREKRLLVNME